ncbi:putative MRG [Monocercomonoides exilis]|uniref:putative MRG n=1 Tax=Monocercomonoides exilis TaxID=2049356 RepID=UPI00355AC81F|nr:putative MRG [Monocercomonoides exilis]|eukprot:MONOS_10163.1-p1 / transcript=MONOS_10163.1 / gene=MONOS_10163 / organism=Monocercomonoides_exilis_PA203 / gene_product=unspecified product / transcript_product=unspecified product / location=Mono_scaffold00450:31265-33160(+) / protein_length=588 / sequence_SO=supercontig / SO=protein_coding / is_pseudo=false
MSAEETYEVNEAVFAKSGVCYYKAIIMEIRGEGLNMEYLVHYPGWSSTLDEWVSVQKLLKKTKENTEMTKKLYYEELKKEKEAKLKRKQKKKSSKKTPNNFVHNMKEESNDTHRQASNKELKVSKNVGKNVNLHENEQQNASGNEQFKSRDKHQQSDSDSDVDAGEMIEDWRYQRRAARGEGLELYLTVDLKTKMIEEFTSVTTGLMIVPLPCQPNVSSILSAFPLYIQERRKQVLRVANRQKVLWLLNSTKEDEEGVIRGIFNYFNVCMGPMLLTEEELIQFQYVDYLLRVNRAKLNAQKELMESQDELQEEDDFLNQLDLEKVLAQSPEALQLLKASHSTASSSEHAICSQTETGNPFGSEMTVSDQLSSVGLSPKCSLSNIFSSSQSNTRTSQQPLCSENPTNFLLPSKSESNTSHITQHSSQKPEKQSNEDSSVPPSSSSPLPSLPPFLATEIISKLVITSHPPSPELAHVPIIPKPPFRLPPTATTFADVYGVEHLLRLVALLPSLLDGAPQMQDEEYERLFYNWLNEFTRYLQSYKDSMFTSKHVEVDTLDPLYLDYLENAPPFDDEQPFFGASANDSATLT